MTLSCKATTSGQTSYNFRRKCKVNPLRRGRLGGHFYWGWRGCFYWQKLHQIWLLSVLSSVRVIPHIPIPTFRIPILSPNFDSRQLVKLEIEFVLQFNYLQDDSLSLDFSISVLWLQGNKGLFQGKYRRSQVIYAVHVLEIWIPELILFVTHFVQRY